MSYHHIFPEVFIQLSREIQHPLHVALQEKLLADTTAKDFVDRLVIVATYCLVAVDGHYTEEDLEKVAGICLERLKSRREIVISPH